jgi:hypothetical protein
MHQPSDHLRVDDHLPGGDPVDGLDEAVTVLHPVLDEVARRMCRDLQQPDRIGGLRVMRQHQQADVGVARPDLLGCPETLVAVAWWKADVEQNDVGWR